IEYTASLSAENPYIGAKINRPNAYRYPLTRYDYTIFYRVRPRFQVVEILRVVHGKQVRNVTKIPS
ncbi:MAG: type II toxin-antitoxin system RelE/ParE family toxin, partial [Pseudomonadota bacterium]